MTWNLDDLPVFVAVVDEGGVTAAARALGRPKSTVSATLARLEAAIGLRLLERGARSVRLTAEGETLYAQAVLILEQAREAEAAMAGHQAVPRGRLAVALPPAYAQEIVAPRLPGFQMAYPEIELDLEVTGHGLELLPDRVDLAVVVGPLEDSDLISRRLMGGRLIWVAHPDYAAETEIGDSSEALAAHVRIIETRYGRTPIAVHADGQAGEVRLPRETIHVNDPLVVRAVVMAGGGVSLLPERYCRDQIARGALVELGRAVRVDRSAALLSAVWSSRRHPSPRLRAFLAFLVEAAGPA